MTRLRGRVALQQSLAQSMKLCRTCQIEKPIEEFGYNNLRHHCRDCGDARYKAARKIRKLRRMGLANSDYLILVETQILCPICLRIPKKWHLDHHHKTNQFRGRICSSCNLAIGLLGDDPSRGIRAAQYLRERDSSGRHPMNPSAVGQAEAKLDRIDGLAQEVQLPSS